MVPISICEIKDKLGERKSNEINITSVERILELALITRASGNR